MERKPLREVRAARGDDGADHLRVRGRDRPLRRAARGAARVPVPAPVRALRASG